VIVVKPERVGFGKRRRRPERLLLSGLRSAPMHVFVGRRRPYDGVQWRELGVGRNGRVETSAAAAAEEQRPGRAGVLFVVAHRARGLLDKVLLEERLARTRAGRLFRGAGERGREYLVSVETQFPATAAVLLLLLVVGLRRVVGLLQRRRVRRELFQRRVGERQAVHLIAGRRRLHRRRTERRRRRLLGLGREETAAAAASPATATDAHAWRERRRVHRHGRRRCDQRCERRRRRYRLAGGRRLKALLQRLKVRIRRRRQIVDGRPAVGRQVYRGRQVRGLLLLAADRRHRLQRRWRHGHREHVVWLLVMVMVLQATDPGHGVRLYRNVLPASSQQTC